MSGVQGVKGDLSGTKEAEGDLSGLKGVEDDLLGTQEAGGMAEAGGTPRADKVTRM